MWDKTYSCIIGLYVVSRRVIWCPVKFRRAIPCDPSCCKRILSEPYIYYKEGKKVWQIGLHAKLSALQHRCLRFPWTEIQYSFDQRRFFFKKCGANPQRAQINKKKRHPRVGYRICKATDRSAKSACRPKHMLYLPSSVSVKPLLMSPLDFLLMFPLPPPPFVPSLHSTRRSLCAPN